MRIVDTSVLLPAVSPSLPQHHASRTALEAAINDDRPLGLTWVVVNAFLRLTTKPGLFERPLTIDAAWDLVDDWLAHPGPTRFDRRGDGGAIRRDLRRTPLGRATHTHERRLDRSERHGARYRGRDPGP